MNLFITCATGIVTCQTCFLSDDSDAAIETLNGNDVPTTAQK